MSSGVPSATISPPFRHPRPKIQDPVRGLDHVEIVLDHDHRIPLLDQLVEHFEQLRARPRNAGPWVGSSRMYSVWPVARRQFLGELDALGLAALKVVACWPTLM